jgi:hypothetical protein
MSHDFVIVIVIVIVLSLEPKQQLRLKPKTNAQLIDQLITLACVHWRWREEQKKRFSSRTYFPLTIDVDVRWPNFPANLEGFEL